MDNTCFSLKTNQSSCVIDRAGGRIREVVIAGRSILSTFGRIDGKTGNTHLCTPNFGAEGKEMWLPFHGPSRGALWEKTAQTESLVRLDYEMPQTGSYPGGLAYSQEFSLGEHAFRHAIIVRNNGLDSLPVNLGIHDYWATKKGWEQASVNGKNIAELVRANGHVPLLSRNIIGFPDGRIEFRQEGFADAVVWAAFSGPVFDTSYVCIEPVRSAAKDYFGSARSILAAGKTLSVFQEILI